MLKYLYKYLLIFFAAVFASACVEMPEADLSEYITFEISELITKGSEPADESTEFAIWIYNEEKPYISADEYRLKYDSNSSCWRFYNVNTSQFEDIAWKTGLHEFYAFSVCDFYQGESFGMSYPNLSYYFGPSANFSLSALNMTDPSDPSKKNYSNDLLRAMASCTIESAKDCKPVSLQFNHVFASLKFTIHNNTQETKEVSAFEISNIKISTSSTSTISSHSEYDSFAALGNASTDNKYSVAEGFTLASGESRDVFNGPVMVWPQSWDTGNKPKLTITSNGVTTVTDIGLGTASTQSWEKGVQYDYVINLNTETPPVIIEPSALSVDHVWENDILTGSKVIVNLGLTEEQKKRITNLKIEVTDGSTVYKSYSSATVTDNNIEFDSGGDKYYIKSGTYNVKFTYNDGIADREVTKTVTSTTPNYKFTYVIYATATSFTIHSAKVNIADRVLAEVPLAPVSAGYGYLRIECSANDYQYITPSSSINNSTVVDFTSSEFIKDYSYSDNGAKHSGGYKYYNIQNRACFDGKGDQPVTFVTFNNHSAGNINITLYDTQYERGNQIQHCTEMSSDALYVIVKASSNYYLNVSTSNDRLQTSTSAPSTNDLPVNYVFQFDVDTDKQLDIESGYVCSSPAGVFRSAWNMKYMNTATDPFFDQRETTNGRYLKCADGWNTPYDNSGYGIDICYTGNNVLIYYGTYPYFNTPAHEWKWNIYRVNANRRAH